MSFEYLPIAAERAIACVERLTTLGTYRFRRSRVETHRWWDQRWLDATTMISVLHTLDDGRSGDVYAVRQDGPGARGVTRVRPPSA